MHSTWLHGFFIPAIRRLFFQTSNGYSPEIPTFAFMKTRILLFSLLALLAVSCQQNAADAGQSAISGADSAKNNATQAPDVIDAEGANRPALKSEADRTKIKQQWADAIAAEKKLLGSPKLIGWMGDLKFTTDEDGFDQPGKLTDAQFKGLSFSEKFCYYLFHPEMASQNCSMAFFDVGLIQGISGSLPFDGEEYPSDRQLEAMNTQKAELEKWILKSISTNKEISIPMMQAVVAFEVKSAIVPLLDLYQQQTVKDDLLLSTCIEMMRKAEYADWSSSNVATEMREEMGGDYQGEMRDFAALNDANVQEIIALAKKFAGV